MSTDKLRVESNERMDIQDFTYLARDSVESNHRQMLTQLFTNPSKTRKWILGGFDMSNPAAKQLQVDKGRAIAAFRDGGTICYGLLISEGDTYKTVDLNTYGSGTYGIYIRFEYVEGESESRIFWNPAGAGSEYAQTIPTRYLANWSVRVEVGSPGDEWTKIGEVVQSTMAITDQRDFYFEGSVSGSYASVWSSDGGGAANDRNADRAQYGVTDYQTFISAMRQCLEDVKGRGLRRWWERDIGGMNLGFDAAPVEDRLAIGNANHYLEYTGGVLTHQYDGDGNSFTFTSSAYEGVFKVAGTDRWKISAYGLEAVDSNQCLGKSGSKWLDLYLSGSAYIDTDLEVGDSAVITNNLDVDTIEVGTEILPDAAKGADIGSSSLPFNLLHGHSYWSRCASGDSDYPGYYLYSGDGTADKRAWRWAIADTGDAQFDMVNDAGSYLNTVMRFVRDTSPEYLKRVEFLGNASTGVVMDLYHDGGGGSRNRYRMTLDDDTWKFNVSDDTGSSTAEQFRIVYDTGTKCYLQDFQMSYWKLGYIKPAQSNSSLGDATNPWPILELATGASVGAKTIEPYDTSSSYLLGTASYPWYSAYLDRIVLGIGSGEGFSSPVYPAADGSWQIGLADRRFTQMFLEQQIRIHDDAVGSVTMQLGSGTTADDRKWEIIAGNILTINTRDQNWANGDTAISIYRSGAALSSIRLGTDLLPDATGGSGNIGNTSYYFVEGWLGNLYLKHADPLIRIHDTGASNYWQISVGANIIGFYRMESGWTSAAEIFSISMSDVDTVLETNIHGLLELVDGTTYMNPSQDHAISIVGPASAPTVQEGWIKIKVAGSEKAIPYVDWADID